MFNIDKYINNINIQYPPRDWNVKDIRGNSLVLSDLKYYGEKWYTPSYIWS